MLRHAISKTLLPLLFVLAAPAALAEEITTMPALAFRALTNVDPDSTFDVTLTHRVIEDFKVHDMDQGDIRYSHKLDSNDDISVAYHSEFNRNTSAGNEHRPWVQLRHQLKLPLGTLDLWGRLEERYFDYTKVSGSRFRWMTRWSTPVTQKDVFRIGYEVFYNLNYISRTTQAGVGQERLVSTLQHTLPGGDRVEFEWQARYLHIPGGANRIESQLQLMYIYNF